jgi:soluble lytic murein transglycosylase-like protein
MFETIILMAAKAAKVSGALLLAVCTHESGLNNVYVPHDGGSPTYGVCQIKYDTAVGVGYKGDPKGLMDPKTNAKFAARYLKFQESRYNGDFVKMAAAYNAGTYNESKKVPGCPRNLAYIKNVQKQLEDNLQFNLSCGKDKKEYTKICLWYGNSGSECFYPRKIEK